MSNGKLDILMYMMQTYAFPTGTLTCWCIKIAEVYFSLQNIKKLCIWSIKAHLPYIYVMYYFRPHKNKILIQIMALQERNLNP